VGKRIDAFVLRVACSWHSPNAEQHPCYRNNSSCSCRTHPRFKSTSFCMTKNPKLSALQVVVHKVCLDWDGDDAAANV
jgi:hypothetical protein